MSNLTRTSIIDRVAARFGRKPKPARAPRTLRQDVMRMVMISTAAVFGIQYGPPIVERALGVHDDRSYAEQSAPLTTGEAALARAVFGPDFQTGTITKHYHRAMPPTHDARNARDVLAYVLLGDTNDIHMIAAELRVKDLSRVPDTGVRANAYMHEMTHIWQHRTGSTAESCGTYAYTLNPQSHFGDFCNEQQAAIVGDYVAIYLQPDSFINGAMALNARLRLHEMEELARVVETQFPHARTARLQLRGQFIPARGCLNNSIQQMQRTQAGALDVSAAWQRCVARHVRTVAGERLTTAAAEPVLPETPPRNIIASVRRVWGGVIS